MISKKQRQQQHINNNRLFCYCKNIPRTLRRRYNINTINGTTSTAKAYSEYFCSVRSTVPVIVVPRFPARYTGTIDGGILLLCKSTIGTSASTIKTYHYLFFCLDVLQSTVRASYYY
jgi:hypothetical protein